MANRKAPKNTYWRGSKLWGRISVAGKVHQFSLRTGDAKTATRRLEEKRNQLVGEAHFSEQDSSYSAALETWAAWIQHHVSPKTAKRYAVSLKQLSDYLMPLSMAQIDTKRIGEIVKARRAAGVSNATIRRDLTALSSVMSYAEAEGMREDNPALTWARRVRERRDPIMLPEPAHIRRIITRAPAAYAALIEAAWMTGCRMDELVSARRSQFDRARRQFTIAKGKGNKLRVISLDERALALFDRLPVAIDSPWLFHEGGTQLRYVSGRFRNLVKAEARSNPDFRPFRFHDLRHAAAVDWLKAGGSIYDLQQRLGHTSVKTTEIYLAYLTGDETRVVKYGAMK